jgi:hypothetical protein
VIQTISFWSFTTKERLAPADPMAVAHKRAALQQSAENREQYFKDSLAQLAG